MILFIIFASARSKAQSVEAPNSGGDDLAQPASWAQPDLPQIKTEFSNWLNAVHADVDTVLRVMEQISIGSANRSQGEMIDVVVTGIGHVRPDVERLVRSLQELNVNGSAPDFSGFLENPDEHAFVRDHVRLFVARWLAQNRYYDESIMHLRALKVANVLDPVSLLYYRGLMEHQLLRKDDCVKSLNKLLENPDVLPQRYMVLSRLMLADISPLEPDSLDEISRLMRDIGRRTALYRSGKLVLGQEEQVIEKLDKLIEKLESQQQSRQTQGDARAGDPMQDSIKAPGKGSGDVTRKRLDEGGSWGDLPPAERAAALAEMAKDMPPHYREVIEEYFRRLARENDR